jgi:hypothetical protein
MMVKDPIIKETSFGTITVDKNTYEKDIHILSDGKIKRRKKISCQEDLWYLS